MFPIIFLLLFIASGSEIIHPKIDLTIASTKSSDIIINPKDDTVISFSGIHTIEGVSKVELFTRARQWYNETFKSSNDVLQINDKETGELSGKGSMQIPITYRYMGERTALTRTMFSVSIWVKDGKFKYSFTNFDISDENFSLGLLSSAEKCPTKWPMISKSKMDQIWMSAKKGAEAKTAELIELLDAKMNKKADSDF